MASVNDVNGAAMLDLIERLGGTGPWDLPAKVAVGPFVWGDFLPGTAAGAYNLKATNYAVDPLWQQIGGSSANPQIKMIVVGHRLIIGDAEAETDAALGDFETESYLTQVNGNVNKRQRFWSGFASYKSQIATTATSVTYGARKGGVYRYPAPWLLDFNRDETIQLTTPASTLTATRSLKLALYGIAFPNDWDLPMEQINSALIRQIAASNQGFLIPNHEIF